MHRILVLGGYGFFGRRICATLARNARIQLVIAGRDAAKAISAAAKLGLPPEHAQALDAADPQLHRQLVELGINTVIHTAGPFQAQDPAVARAAIDAGSHYIDIADGREFVVGITALDAAARARGVLVVSGASSVPGLSSAVIDRHAPQFSRLDSIEIGISSGARAPGLATIRGVFSYCGKSFRVLQDGEWIDAYGWLDTRRHHFPEPVGRRYLGRCNVPDLDLFARRHAGVRTVSFHAGFPATVGHRTVELLAALVKLGLLPGVKPFARPLNAISRWIEPLVSDSGAMFVRLRGLDHASNAHEITWHLMARNNHGPYIPCGAAMALANKLAAGAPLPTGAMPCMGLLSIEEYLEPLNDLDIRQVPP